MKTSIKLLGFLFSLCLFIVSCEVGEDKRPVAEVVPGVSESEILIGSSLALEGHASYLGRQTLCGAMTYINHVNKNGGIHGRKIRLIAYDDGYEPPRCLANTQKLIIEDKVFALFCYVGSPTTVKIIPLVQEARIPLLGMFTGANALREPLKRYIFNVRASYYQETEAAVRYFLDDLGIKKIAVFYQYDDYGFDGLRGTELALKGYGLVPVATGTYARGTLDVEEGLSRICDSGAEAVIMIGTYDPCAKFIKLAKAWGFEPIFHNVSFVGGNELARKLGFETCGVIVTQVVPPPEAPITQTLLLGARNYVELLKKYYPDSEPNAVGLEGYLNARVLVEGLERAGRNLTRERFIEAVESIRNFSLGIANTLTFGPDDHQGFERVYFTKICEGKLDLIVSLQDILNGR